MKKLRSSIVLKSISGIILMLIVFSLIVCVIGYREFTEELLDQYADGAFIAAETSAMYVDPESLDLVEAEGEKAEVYRTTWQELDRVCNLTGATFIYVIRPDLSDYGHITFLYSTILDGTPYEHYEFGYVRETTNQDYRDKYRALYEGRSDRELVIRDKGYIETDHHITAMIPLRDSAGQTQGILCVQRQMEGLSAARRGYVNKVIVTMIMLAIIVCYGQSVYLRRMLLDPVRVITREASRFARENVHTGKKLRDSISNEDEIGLLADSIDNMEAKIQTYVEDLTRATAEKERISTEMSMAARIQAHMLPDVFPAFPDRKEFDIYAVMDPAREVGGDFYDFFLIDEDHLCLAIADVSGKGVPAALFMMVAKNFLEEDMRQGCSPSEAMERLNALICSNNPDQMFITVWLGILEISTGRLTAANAGHEYPILKQGSGPYEEIRDKHCMALGAMEGIRFKDYELTLTPGSRLFVYTDGVPEATDGQEKMFGVPRLLETLNQAQEETPQRTLGHVRQAVDTFVGEAEQFDDLTMLCLELH